MRFFLSTIAASMLFLLSPLAMAMADGDKKTKEARQQLRLINKALPDLVQILSLTQKEERIDEEQRYILLRQLVRSINPFMDLADELPAPAKIKTQNFPLIKLEQGRILYFRLDSFASENIKSFMDSKKIPGGIILDLRNCSGFDNENMAKVLQHCKAMKTTIICLLGKNTRGAAELLALAVAKLPDGVSLGSSSAGHPFAHKAIELESGFVLLIPKIPAFIKKLPKKSVEPTISCPGKKQVEYLKLKKSQATAKDSSLRAAMDLLSVVKQIR